MLDILMCKRKKKTEISNMHATVVHWNGARTKCIESSQHKAPANWNNQKHKSLFRRCALDKFECTRKVLCLKYALARWRWLAIYLHHISNIILSAQLFVCVCALCLVCHVYVCAVNVESLTISLAPHRIEFNFIIAPIYTIHNQHFHIVRVVLGTCTLVKATRRKHPCIICLRSMNIW